MKNAASIQQLKYKVNKLAALLLPNNILLFCVSFSLFCKLCVSRIPSFRIALS